MPLDDWDDDDDRPLRRRRARRDDENDEDFDDEYDIRTYRSGAVTGVAVINFVLGSIVLLLGFCGLIGVIFAAGEAGRAGAFGLPGASGGFAVVFLVVIVVLLWGIAAIIAGIGIVNRSQWGRVLGLVLGGFAALGGLFFFLAAVAALAAGPGNPNEAEDRAIGFIICLFAGMVLVGYCIWSYVVLLSSRSAADFR